jgi:mono/diheme cytochrome c family protein
MVGVLLLLVAAPVFLLAGGDPAAGKAVYDKKCATCHGKDGAGNEKMGAMLKVEFRALGSKDVQAKKDEELRKDIVEGTGKMKPVKGMTDAEIENVIAYVRSMKK